MAKNKKSQDLGQNNSTPLSVANKFVQGVGE